MTRIGKIARLPHEIRERLNRRLQDGEQGKDLVEWLNSLPEVTAVLQAEFEGRPINEQNVSDWRAGGYRDWLTQQQTIELVQRLVADAKEVGEAAQTPLADQMAMWLAGRYAVFLQRLAAADGSSASDCEELRKLCRDLVDLRRGDHSAARLRLERERLDLEKAENRENWLAEFEQWMQDSEVQKKYCPKMCEEEKMWRIRMRLWGSAPMDRPIGENEEKPPENNDASPPH